MATYWRYFRVDGKPSTCTGDVFTMKIHHGGRFYSQKGCNRNYKGGEVVYVDGCDADKMSLPELNCWANDLGYQAGPIGYWFRIPGSEQGTGYLPIINDKDVTDMCRFVPTSTKLLEFYIVCLAPRYIYTEEELSVSQQDLDHSSYLAQAICDIEEDVDEETHRLPEYEDMADGLEDMFFRNFMYEARLDGDTEIAGFGPEMEILEPESVVNERVGVEIVTQQSSRQAPKKKAVDKGKQKVVEGDVPAPEKRVRRPKKPVVKRYSTRSRGECSTAIDKKKSTIVCDSESSSSTDSDDPNFDGIVDSDYESVVSEDDDVEFRNNVDGDTGLEKELEQMGFQGDISEDEVHDSDREPSFHGSSDEGEDRGMFPVKCRRRFSDWEEFNIKVDMRNPRFKAGMLFANSEVFKQAVRKHSVLTKKELRFPTNSRHKMVAKCKTSKGCPWRVYASAPSQENPTLMIKRLNLKHRCALIGKKKKVYHLNAPFLAEEFKEFFLNDPTWSTAGMQNSVKKDFGYQLGYQMAHRAKVLAMKRARGSVADQYNLLESYAAELKKRNPGTSVWIQTELNGEVARFKRIYICIEALKRGWKEGCRPIIGLDGCHLKTVMKGQLLSAVGIDGNNGFYPIAWAIVESETRDSWQWFLQFLKEDLGLHFSGHCSFMSDKQKGLENVIKDLFPDSQHRHCVRHLHNNFKNDGHGGLELKQKFWAVARACTMRSYADAMEDLKKSSPDAWKWAMKRPAIHWSKSHFFEKFKCDILLNNHSESFNKSILDARKKPILPCLEDIRVATMTRLANRRNSGPNWRCKVGPRVEKQLKKNAEFAANYVPRQSSEHRFEIQGLGVACASGVVSQHAVALDLKSCTCKRWDISGLPCGHAICALYSKGKSPDEFVDNYFTKEKYMAAYEPIMHPIAGVQEWDIINRPIAPPIVRRQPGRQKMARNKEAGEVAPDPGATSLPKVYYTQIHCGECGVLGHNKRTCPKLRNQAPNANEQPQVHEEVPAPNVHPQVIVPAPGVQPQTQEEVPAAHLHPQAQDEVPAPSFVPAMQSQQSNNGVQQTQSTEHASSSMRTKQRRNRVLSQKKQLPSS